MRPDFRKIWVVAATEFGTSVRTKAFIVGLLLLPILVGSSILLQMFVMRRVDTRTRTVAVVDRTEELYPAIEQAAQAYNDQTLDPQGKAVRPRIEPDRGAGPGPGRPRRDPGAIGQDPPRRARRLCGDPRPGERDPADGRPHRR